MQRLSTRWINNAPSFSKSFEKLHAFAKKGHVTEAERIWMNEIKGSDDIDTKSYGFMMKFYLKHNRNESVLSLFDEISAMNKLHHNNATYLLSLSASSNISSKRVQLIHHQIITNNVQSIKVWNALILSYGKCRDLALARKVFSKALSMETRDTATYVAMIGALAPNKQIEEAQKTFDDISDDQMNAVVIGKMMNVYLENAMYSNVIELYLEFKDKAILNDVCYLIVLKSCTKAKYYDLAKSVIDQIKVTHSNNNVFIQTQLIGTYGKMGNLDAAQRVFDGMGSKDIVAWTAMIDAFGINGKADESLKLFHKMQKIKGLEVGSVAYLAIINALSHCGNVGDAINVFEDSKVNKKCNEKIYGAMIDCYARCGQLVHAQRLLAECEAVFAPNRRSLFHHILISVMNGCKIYNDLKSAQKIFDRIKRNKSLFKTKEDVVSKATGLMKDIYAQNNVDNKSEIEVEMQHIIQNMRI